jgi:hypothetical protein
VQCIKKRREEGEYMNRELGEGLKLFLESGSDCESVIWRRRRRIIREIEK